MGLVQQDVSRQIEVLVVLRIETMRPEMSVKRTNRTDALTTIKFQKATNIGGCTSNSSIKNASGSVVLLLLPLLLLPKIDTDY